MEAFLNHLKTINLPLYNILKELNDEIINIVNFYSNMKFLGISQLSGMIMNDIKNSITDVTLILNDGTIKAYKPILSIIPYFKCLFEDCEGDEVVIDASFSAMKIIIDAVYFSHIQLNNNDLLEVMRLMDMFMYWPYPSTIVYFLYAGGLSFIINKSENIKELVLIEMLIYHMRDFNQYKIDRLKKEFKVCHPYMFSFTHWHELFTEEEQLSHILISKNYELFNKTNIKPKIIIKSLIDALPETNCYYDLFYTTMYFNKDYITAPCSIIKSYYPLSYISIHPFNYPSHGHEIGDNRLRIDLSKSIMKVTIGSKILLIENENEININDYYTIIAIHKKVNGILIPTTQLIYFEDIEYTLTFDKPIYFKNNFKSMIMNEVVVNV